MTLRTRIGPSRLALLSLAVVAALLAPAAAQPGGGAASVHLALGNPSRATQEPSAYDNFLIPHDQFVLAYSRTRGAPKWVSWHLDNSDLGERDRSDAWHSDDMLPEFWFHVTHETYTNSGYDRGHVCPSADRTATDADNRATFVMTNIVPQTADLNRGPWARLEDYCRDLVRTGSELYIIGGVYGQRATIADGRVTVPTASWKVIVVLPQGDGDLARIGPETRVIAVEMPNVPGIRQTAWSQYRVSVDQVESLTGFDFLSALGTAVQSVLERRADAVPE